MLIAFAILRTKHKMEAENDSVALTTSSFALLPKSYTTRPCYHILAAYLVAGVRGLLMIPSNMKHFPLSHSLELISLVSRSIELQPQEVDEPIWKRTNSYIVQLIQTFFFLPTQCTPSQISRFTLAKCLVLDFSDHWLASNSDSSVFNLPRRTNVGRSIQHM